MSPNNKQLLETFLTQLTLVRSPWLWDHNFSLMCAVAGCLQGNAQENGVYANIVLCVMDARWWVDCVRGCTILLSHVDVCICFPLLRWTFLVLFVEQSWFRVSTHRHTVRYVLYSYIMTVLFSYLGPDLMLFLRFDLFQLAHLATVSLGSRKKEEEERWNGIILRFAPCNVWQQGPGSRPHWKTWVKGKERD